MNFIKEDELEKDEIFISHFTTPNSFYYRYVSKNDELCLLDELVEKDAKTSKQDKKYKIGQKVIVEFLPHKKFLRGVIDDIKTDYIVWAIDYGFPISTSIKFLYKMTKHLEEFDGEYVLFGGISNVIPAKEVYDYSKCKYNIIGEKSWDGVAINHMEKFLYTSQQIWFKKSKTIPIPGERFQDLGDLEVRVESNKIKSFKDYLIEKKYAIEVPADNFLLTLKKIRTNAIVRYRNYALVECGLRNERPTKPIPEEDFEEVEETVKVPEPVYEYDDDDESIELNEKISDWNLRNEAQKRKAKCYGLEEDDSQDDDIAFDDSVSCAAKSPKSISWMKKTRSIDEARKKFGNLVLRPPSFVTGNDTFEDVAPNKRPPKVEKDPSVISLRARHLEIFKKLQEKENETKEAERFLSKAEDNINNDQEEILWNTGSENTLKPNPKRMVLPAGYDISNLNKRTPVIAARPQNSRNYYQPSSSSSNVTAKKNFKNPINLNPDFQIRREIEKTNEYHLKPLSSSENDNCQGDEIQSEISESSSTKMSTAQKIALKAKAARINYSLVSTSSSENPLQKSLDNKHDTSEDKESSISSSYKAKIAAASQNLRNSRTSSKVESLRECNLNTLGKSQNVNPKKLSNIEKIMQMKAAMLLTKTDIEQNFEENINHESQKSEIESLKSKSNTSNINKIEALKKLMLKPKDFDSISSKSSISVDKEVSTAKLNNSKTSKIESLRETIYGTSSKASSSSPKIEATQISKESEIQNIADQLKIALKDNNVEEFLKQNSTNLFSQTTFQKFQEPEIAVPMEQNLVMIHGKYVIPPVTNIRNVGFMNELLKELKDYHRLRRIQSFAWPSIIRGQSIVVINTEKSGKTMSYLPIVCNFVANEYFKGIICDNIGPIACLIVPTSVEVEHITRLANKFLRKCDEKIPVVGMFGVQNESECMVELLKSCGIFIGTPACYRKLLSSEITFFDPKRVKIVVIDEVEISKELEVDVLRKVVPLKKISDFQLVIVSKKWQPVFIKYLTAMENMVLCIGHYLEAAVYAKAHLRIELKGNKEKIQSVLKFVKKYYFEYTKFIIVCNDDEEIEDLLEALNRAAYNSLIISSETTSEEMRIVKDWSISDEKCAPILICSDMELRQLNISNAQILVHYSLPSSWSKFCFRFSTLMGFYKDYVKLNFEVESCDSKPARSLILLDEQNNVQLPKLIKFMTDHGYQNLISPEIIEVAKQIKIQAEISRSKEMMVFCEKALEFGECFSDSCAKRHLFTKFDVAFKGIPTDGIIKIEILNVHSPTYYTACLLAYNVNSCSLSDPNSWKYLRGSNEFSKFSVRLSLFYSNPDNLNNEWPLSLNKMCTYMDRETFHRCIIIEHPPGLNDHVMKSVRCVIKLVDTGEFRVVKSVDILKIPEEFQMFPWQAVEIRLIGIVPHHNEKVWDKKSCNSVKRWLTQDANPENHFICAKINFALMDKIWVDNVVVMENIKGFESVQKINIRSSILKKNFGTKSEIPEQRLKEMAKDCGIQLDQPFKIEDEIEHVKVSKVNEAIESENEIFESASDASFMTEESDNESPKKFSKSVVKPTEKALEKPVLKKDFQVWDTLEEENYYKVNIGSFVSPSELYVYKMDSPTIISKCNELENMIQTFLEKKKVPISDFEIGKDCIAYFQGVYNRGKISKIEAVQDSKVLQIFFCDFGQSLKLSQSEVYETSEEIVKFLPYQAIQCKLTGINPKNSIWEESLCNQIYDEIVDTIDENSFWQAYPVKSVSNSENILKFNSYEVILLTDEAQINNAILKRGFAVPDENTSHFLDLGDMMDNGEDLEFEMEMGIEEMSQSLGIPREVIEKAVAKAKEENLSKMAEQKLEPKICEIKEEEPIKTQQIPKKEKILNEKVYKSKSQLKYHERYLLKTIPRPITTWFQTIHSISLIIAAPDINDNYHLKITDNMVLFAYMYEEELKLLELHLLATIKPEESITKIRGNNFHIRLRKAVPIMWPRLTFSNDKYTWLKYHYDKFVEDSIKEDSKKKQIQIIQKAVDDDNLRDDEEGLLEEVFYRQESKGQFKETVYNQEENIDDYNCQRNDEFDPLDDEF